MSPYLLNDPISLYTAAVYCASAKSVCLNIQFAEIAHTAQGSDTSNFWNKTCVVGDLIEDLTAFHLIKYYPSQSGGNLQSTIHCF